MSDYPALPGFYKYWFVYIEPFTTFSPLVTCTLMGPGYFLHELIPFGDPQPASIGARTDMALWQLANSYLLLCLISVFVLTTVKDTLRNQPIVQERIVGAMLKALVTADIMHVIITFRGLPAEIKYHPSTWNMMTHGNITFCLALFASRISWFLGIGRTRYESLHSQTKVN